MGVCSCKGRIGEKQREIFVSVYEKGRSKVIMQEVDLMFEEFKEDLLCEVINNFPCSSTELDRKIGDCYKKNTEKFVAECAKKIPSMVDARRATKFFQIKCKSQEGYMRYFNDYYSLKVVHEIKSKLIDSFISKNIGKAEILNLYYKQAKGTYFLQGFEELHEVFSQDILFMQTTLDNQYTINLEKLQLIYSDIALSKIIDLEIYNKTIGVIQKECILK